MKHDTLATILQEQPAVKVDGKTYNLAGDAEATLFVGSAGGLLTVPKVVRVELRRDHLVALDVKRQQYYFDYASIVGIRVQQLETSRTSRATGFR